MRIIFEFEFTGVFKYFLMPIGMTDGAGKIEL